jgi:DEAD/DEAH box helicase
MPRLRWQDPQGQAVIKEIVKVKIPAWKDGLHLWQLELVSRILDGESALCNTATGDGKSAVFGVPLVVLLEMASNPSAYPDLPYRAKPIGIVVTPTKGLAANIVRVRTGTLLELLTAPPGARSS